MENKYSILSILDIYPPAESGLEACLILSRGQLFTSSEEQPLEKWGVQYKLPGEKSFELFLYGKDEIESARELFNQFKAEIDNYGLISMVPDEQILKELFRSYPPKDPYLFLKPVEIEGKTKWKVSYDSKSAGRAHIISSSYSKANEMFNNFIRQSIKTSADIEKRLVEANQPKKTVETTKKGVVIEITEE